VDEVVIERPECHGGAAVEAGLLVDGLNVRSAVLAEMPKRSGIGWFDCPCPRRVAADAD